MRNNAEELLCKKYTKEEANITVKRLVRVREEQKIDRKKLETLCDGQEFPTSYTTITHYEQIISDEEKQRNTVRGMRLGTFYEICEFYGVSADYLLGFKESRHRETSADYIKADWGFDDGVIQIFKRMKAHMNINFGNKQFSEIDFVSFILKHYLVKFEAVISNYLYNEELLDEFTDKYIDKKTNLYKDADTLTPEEENSLSVEYDDLTYHHDQARYELIKTIDLFLQDLKKEVNITRE